MRNPLDGESKDVLYFSCRLTTDTAKYSGAAVKSQLHQETNNTARSAKMKKKVKDQRSEVGGIGRKRVPLNKVGHIGPDDMWYEHKVMVSASSRGNGEDQSRGLKRGPSPLRSKTQKRLVSPIGCSSCPKGFAEPMLCIPLRCLKDGMGLHALLKQALVSGVGA